MTSSRSGRALADRRTLALAVIAVLSLTVVAAWLALSLGVVMQLVRLAVGN